MRPCSGQCRKKNSPIGKAKPSQSCQAVLVRLLLDTHALLWFFYEPRSLSARATDVISSTENEVFVSAVSAFEIANRTRIGKLDAPVLANNFDDIVASRGFLPLSLTSSQARLAGILPGAHRDPFDRIIAAQALLASLTVVSSDAAFDSFGVQRYW